MNNLNSSDHNRAIIIGAGPVGLTTALCLVKANIPVLVLEANAKPNSEPRASTFHPPTLDLLDSLGLGDKLLELGRKSRTWQYCIFGTEERVVFDLGILAEETNHPYRLQCEQFNLVKEASKILEKNSIDSLIYNAKALNIIETNDFVEVKTEIKGELKSFYGTWLIGADGAGSLVRKSMGLPFRGDTYPTSSISIGSSFPFHNYLSSHCGVNYFWAEGWSFSMFRTKKMWRIGYSPDKNLSDSDALKKEAVQGQLSKIVPNINSFPIDTARIYKVHRRLVDKLRKGRVLLAGDAAHLNSPSGGFGMNGGIHDAFNLSEKLIKVWNGEDAKILDLYSRQRHFAAKSDIQHTSDINHKKHREKNWSKRREFLKEMGEINDSKGKSLEFLRETSLITSLKRSNKIK